MYNNMEISIQPCPYLPDRESRAVLAPDSGLPEELDLRMAAGWRRSGAYFYRYFCPSCSLCLPLRLDPSHALESRRRRARLYRENLDIRVSISGGAGRKEWLELMERYAEARHGSGDKECEESMGSFLCSPCSLVLEYRTDQGALAALSFLDKGEASLSSVYFAFDPREGKRSLGAFSVHKELELAKSWGCGRYYLGLWIPGSRKMDYKAEFHPFEILLPSGRWQAFDNRSEVPATLLSLRENLRR